MNNQEPNKLKCKCGSEVFTHPSNQCAMCGEPIAQPTNTEWVDEFYRRFTNGTKHSQNKSWSADGHGNLSNPADVCQFFFEVAQRERAAGEVEGYEKSRKTLIELIDTMATNRNINEDLSRDPGHPMREYYSGKGDAGTEDIMLAHKLLDPIIYPKKEI